MFEIKLIVQIGGLDRWKKETFSKETPIMGQQKTTGLTASNKAAQE